MLHKRGVALCQSLCLVETKYKYFIMLKADKRAIEWLKRNGILELVAQALETKLPKNWEEVCELDPVKEAEKKLKDLDPDEKKVLFFLHSLSESDSLEYEFLTKLFWFTIRKSFSEELGNLSIREGGTLVERPKKDFQSLFGGC